MMPILIVDTALPLSHGSPRQRNSSARRDLISADGNLRHLTIDIYGTERKSRVQRGRRDSFVCLPSYAAGQEQGRGIKKIQSPDWELWSPRYVALLKSLLTRHPPSSIVIGDPLLFPLLPALASVDCPFHLFVDDADVWHERASLRQIGPRDTDYHLHFAELIRKGVAQLRLLKPHLHRTPSIIFSQDDAFFAKIPTVLTLACGHLAADLHSLALLNNATLAMRSSGYEALDVVAMGFDQALAKEFPEISLIEDFTHVAGMAAAARCVVLPWLSPELLPLAQEILLAGTPVVSFEIECIPPRLMGAEGLILTDSESLPSILEMMLDDFIMGPTQWRAFASAEQARQANLASLEVLRVTPARQPPRVMPLLESPTVLYNPLSRMLLVRLQLRGGSAVEEVRLLDDNGGELTRLMPNSNEKRCDPVTIEGGIVIDLSALGAAIEVELWDSESMVERRRIPVEGFVMLEAELAWLKQEGGLVSCAFWVADSVSTTRWSFALGDMDYMDTGPLTQISMPEIEGRIISFSVPRSLAPKVPLTLNRWVPSPISRLETLEQRQLVPTPYLTQPTRDNNALLESLRGIHKNKRAWIIGNGPSVRIEDIKRIPEQDIKFCFNRFYLSYDLHSLREDYTVSADFLMIKDFGQEMIDIAAGLPLFCVKPGTTESLSGPHVNVSPFDGYLPLFSMDPPSWVAVGGSSVYVALQMAFFMGLRDVVLYGIDYSFSMKLRRDPRFPFPVSFDEGNHFIDSYRSAKPWCPPTWRDISAGFLNARVAFESHGGRILNATRGGKLVTFPRVLFEELVH